MNTTTKIAALAALPAALFAETVTFNDSLAFQFTESLGSNVLTLNQFDSNLGTLTGVKLTIEYVVVSQTLELDNDATGTASGNYNFGEFGADGFEGGNLTTDAGFSQLDASDFSYTTQTFAYNLDPDTGTEGTDTFDVQPGEGDYASFATTEQTYGVTDREINSAVWGLYTGLGTVKFDLAKAYAATITDNTLNGSGVLRQQSALSTGTFSASVTYEYTPAVPESSTYSLIAGALALGWVMVRRRK